MNLRRTFICTLLILSLGVALYAQGTPKPPAPKTHDVFVKAKIFGSQTLTPQGTIQTLKDDVSIKSDDTVFTSELVRYNRTTEVAVSPDRFRIEDPQNNIVADRGTAYYKRRDAELRGNVKIIIKPREADKNAPAGSPRRDFKEPAEITCENLDYNWRSRKGILTGSLTLKQKDWTVTGDKALYDGKAEKVTLIGNVKATSKKGEWFKAGRAVAIIKEGAEALTVDNESGNGIIEGVLKVEDEEEEPTTPAGPGGATGGNTTPPPTSPAPVRPGPGNTNPTPPEKVTPPVKETPPPPTKTNP